jgi:hypothetical protein
MASLYTLMNWHRIKVEVNACAMTCNGISVHINPKAPRRLADGGNVLAGVTQYCCVHV